MSPALLGINIDAVYHTAVVFGGVEYLYGSGVQTSYPGSTHHGRPMEIIPLGVTDLPLDVVLEYLESLKQIYTAEVSSTYTLCSWLTESDTGLAVIRPLSSQLQQFFE